MKMLSKFRSWCMKKSEAASAGGMAIGVFSIVIVGYIVFAILPDFFYQAYLAGNNASAPAGATVLLETVIPIAVVALFVFAIIKKFRA